MKMGVGDDRTLRWECWQRMSWGFRRGNNDASPEKNNPVVDDCIDQLARWFSARYVIVDKPRWRN
jgi:hypothetical protein